jgi:hypothetical protein
MLKTSGVSDFEDVKAFVPHDGMRKVKLWLENGGSPVNSSIVSGASVSFYVSKKERKP